MAGDESLAVLLCSDALTHSDQGNCTNETIGSLDELEADTLDYAEIIMLSIMVVIGGPLNILCFWRSLSPCSRHEQRPRLKNTRQRYVGFKRNSDRRKYFSSMSRSVALRLHLTTANLFIICIYGISQICWLSTYSWKGGDFLCRLIKFFHTFCFYLTSNIIVMIAVDRLYVTTYVDRPARSPTRWKERWFSLTICCIPWLLAFVCSAPQLFVWNILAPYVEKPDW